MAAEICEALLPSKKISWQLQRVLLVASILTNLITLSCVLVAAVLQHRRPLGSGILLELWSSSHRSSPWWSNAAVEAERAAAISCSGHGRVFVDTVAGANGKTICECNKCFSGDDCSRKLENCEANADGGDPLFLEPFWDANANAGAVLISPVHRMSYSSGNNDKRITLELENLIAQVHNFVGNVVMKNKFIVIGTGSTELINAAVASLSPETTSQSPPAIVVSKTPYYNMYEGQTKSFSSTQYVWGGDSSAAAKKFANTGASFVEIVAAPNNPDTRMNEPVLQNRSRSIFDRAYYWPHYSPIFKAADDDVMLFTLSKLTGHAGNRLGWAIIKDANVYARMRTYVVVNTLGVSHDTQLRAAKLLRSVLEGYAKNTPKAGALPRFYAKSQHIFHFGQKVMSSRWQRLQQIFETSNRFSLQQVQPQPCRFFKSTITPSPAYAWVKCNQDKTISCFDVFKKAGIVGREGNFFGVSEQYVRFALLIGNDDFENFMDHLSKIINASRFQKSLESPEKMMRQVYSSEKISS